MKIFILSITMLLLQGTTSAQDSTARSKDNTPGMNGWYVELAGQSLVGATINYERSLSRKPGGLLVHAGAGWIISLWDDQDLTQQLVFPVGLSYAIPLSKNRKNFLEIGGNYVYIGGESIFTGSLSYRLVAKPKGFLFRATFIPFVMVAGESSSVGPWGGFSFGKRF